MVHSCRFSSLCGMAGTPPGGGSWHTWHRLSVLFRWDLGKAPSLPAVWQVLHGLLSLTSWATTGAWTTLS